MIHIKKMKRRAAAWEEQAKQRRSQLGGSVREGLDRLGRRGDMSPRSEGRGCDSGRTGDGSRHASLENVRSHRQASSCTNLSEGKWTPGREAIARWKKASHVASFQSST